MKITLDNLIKFMRKKENINITDEQVEEIKKHFYKDVEALVYWSFTEINRYYEIKLEGLITKEFYNKIKSDCIKIKNIVLEKLLIVWDVLILKFAILYLIMTMNLLLLIIIQEDFMIEI